MFDASVDLFLTILRAAFAADGDAAAIDLRTYYTTARRLIQERYADHGLTPENIAWALGCSRSTLYRAFHAHGTTVARCIREVRLQEAKRASRRETEHAIATISHAMRVLRSRPFPPPVPGAFRHEPQRRAGYGENAGPPIQLRPVPPFDGEPLDGDAAFRNHSRWTPSGAAVISGRRPRSCSPAPSWPPATPSEPRRRSAAALRLPWPPRRWRRLFGAQRGGCRPGGSPNARPDGRSADGREGDSGRLAAMAPRGIGGTGGAGRAGRVCVSTLFFWALQFTPASLSA